MYADIIHKVKNKHHVIEASQDPSSYCAVFSVIGLGMNIHIFDIFQC